MKFKEVIFVVLIMLIFAMVMLMYIVINDSIKASSVPIICLLYTSDAADE